MERRVTVLVAIFFLLLALPGAAQQESGTLAQEFWIKVKPSMARVFEAAYGAVAEFASALRKINEGIRNSDLPSRGAAWFAVVRGERKGSTYVLVFPHKNWADMKAPDKSFWTRVEEIFGRQEAENLRATYRRSIVSRSSSILACRPDLSSVPGGN